MNSPLPNKPEGFLTKNRKSGGYLLKKRAGSFVYSLFRALLLFGLCFLIIQPILDKISVSFMAESDLYDTTVIVLPRHLTLDNYKLANQLLLYVRALLNTVWVSLGVSLLQIAACTLVGYGFARFEFPLKKMWFACVVLLIVIPPQTISSSLYLHFRYFDVFGIVKLLGGGNALNLRGTTAPYMLMSATCMGLKNGLYIFMIRSFFNSVPKSVEEAAYTDGCGTFRTFWRVILPDALPILVSCFLFSFVWQWTDTFYSKLFLGNTQLLSVQLSGLAERLRQYITITLGIPGGGSMAYQQQIISTGTLMVIAPLIILYIFAQRGFVESISASGIKM
ncbi:MAG: carbohydrate ABC transporter permease [Oscillospiraceae bacterium]|jgi:multiple sugar transport system permease protein|nr:carbohydrate ABC transporter permease [Oscillospiraceae bacterium]